MDKRQSRKLLCIAIVFFWASEYCHTPYFTPYLESLGFTATLIGLMTGAYGFTQIFARIPLGMLTDAFSSYKATILFGTICTTVSSFFLMFATSFPAIIFCRVLAGLAASTWLAFSVLYNAYFKDDESVTAMTNINAFNNGGKLLAFGLGLATASFFGIKVPLLCSVLTGLASCICVAFLKPIALKHTSFSFRHIASVVKTPAILAASFFAVLMQFYMQGTVFSFTSGYLRKLGASSFLIGLVSLTFTVTNVLAAGYVGKKLLKNMKPGHALALGYSTLALGALLIAFAPSPWLFVLASAIIGGGNIIINGLLMSMIVRHAPQEKQSTAMGFYQAVYGIGMSSGPALIGRIVNASGYQTAYLSVTALMVMTALLALWILPRVEK
ncbi:MAG: MFS transporter [Spirochaetales bacterium]|nr:MFS transporter [Candidatus Physcosoma equi]